MHINFHINWYFDRFFLFILLFSPKDQQRLIYFLEIKKKKTQGITPKFRAYSILIEIQKKKILIFMTRF